MPAPSRSSSPQVRNPIAAMPEVQAAILGLTPRERKALETMLRAMSRNWKAIAQKSWDSSKAPMAAYHKANSINARHLALALKNTQPREAADDAA
jgi:hypothetical protein